MKKQHEKGFGGLGMFFIGAIIAIGLYIFLYPGKFAKPVLNYAGLTTSVQYCRSFINDPFARTVTAPSYDANTIQIGSSREYRLIKESVPIKESTFADTAHEHFINTFKEKYEDPVTHKKYIMRIPKGIGGKSYNLTPQGSTTPTSLVFADYGILYLFHTDSDYNLVTQDEIELGGEKMKITVADIYKAVDTPDLPAWINQCVDNDKTEMVDANPEVFFEQDTTYFPPQNMSTFKAEEQIGYFIPQKYSLVLHSWWTPHCKPAIYLYPEKDEQVNVQVNIPSGSFLYTDPVYPSSGWNVIAKSTGDLHYLGTNLQDSKGKTNHENGALPYLYYEGRIADSVIDKPSQGFVKKYDELPSFYGTLLPQLGLIDKEAHEFKAYWQKALPKSPYYFIGVVPQDNLNEIEPLIITPKQDTTIRVSLYFEALDTFKIVQAPLIKTPKRVGFTVVEWGGMIKQDKKHPFTCSQ